MKRFNKTPIFLALTSILSLNLFGDLALSKEISPQFNPKENDQQVGKVTVSNGKHKTITSLDDDINQTIGKSEIGLIDAKSLNEMNVTSGKELLDINRLQIGSQNQASKVLDPITGTYRTIKTYNSDIFATLGTIGEKEVKDVIHVNDDQYIDLRVGEVDQSGGTLDVDLGNNAQSHRDKENSLNLAAKQTTLFDVDGSGDNLSELNWNGKNSIEFNAAVADESGEKTVEIIDVPNYGGTFTITAPNGKTYSKTVTDRNSLAEFNDWLIKGIQEGEFFDPRDPETGVNAYQKFYESAFSQAVTIEKKEIAYEQTAHDHSDEIFETEGDRRVIHASGENAIVNINGTLETDVVNTVGYNNATTVIENGATINIGENGVMSSRNSGVLELRGENTIGTNNGMINSSFVTQEENGKLVANAEGNNAVPSFGVKVSDDAYFSNEGVMNHNSDSNEYIFDSVALDLYGSADSYNAVNSGAINIGVYDSTMDNTTIGVRVNTNASFLNDETGEIYIGRQMQNHIGEVVDDVILNQGKLTTGILVLDNASADNDGTITIGTKTQNAAAIAVLDGDNATLNNNGSIIVKGDADKVPNMNYGIFAQNSGANSEIIHNGTIELNGVNAIGILALTNDAGVNDSGELKSSYIQTSEESVIEIKGDADPESGTRNYGVWVAGHEGGKAIADLDGKIILKGDGAIGVHARGNAEINIGENAIPDMIDGTDQIGLFAYGKDTKININGAHKFKVDTDRSVLFRLEDGANLNETGFTLKTIGKESAGIWATGAGGANFEDKSYVYLSQGNFEILGEKSRGVIVEGGAEGLFDKNTQFKQTGKGSIAVHVDGKKHDLSGKETDLGRGNETIVDSSAKVISSDESQGELIGYRVKNGAQLIHKGEIDYTHGNDNIGIWVTGGDKDGIVSEIANLGKIHVNHGTGLLAEGKGASTTQVGTVTVDDGTAGVQIKDGAALHIKGDNNKITTNGTAHGILVDNDAQQLIVENSVITVNGTGNGIENRTETSNILLKESIINVKDGSGIRTSDSIANNSEKVIINVTGSGIGFNFETSDGAESKNNLMLGSMNPYLDNTFTINVSGANGVGINANTPGKVVTTANVNITDAKGGSALIIGEKTKEITNYKGKLISESDSAPVVDLSNGDSVIFKSIEGEILAKDANHVAVLGTNGVDQLIFDQGKVRGEIIMNDKDSSLVMVNTDFEGGITMNGKDSIASLQSINIDKTAHIKASNPDDSALELTDVQGSVGTFENDNITKGTNLGNEWNSIKLGDKTVLTLVDNLDLSGDNSTLDITSTATLNAGGEINPTINAHKVINSGIIDLTNGNKTATDDSLTINGHYDSVNGQLHLNTLLNEGGELSNQKTDRLLINGDVSGKTILHVNSAGLDDTGASTDLNQNGTVEANEGISIIQVAGISSKEAFQLAHGYVASGAFRYELYSFDPSQSDRNGHFLNTKGGKIWDYRLANTYVTDPNHPVFPPDVWPSVPGNPEVTPPDVWPSVPGNPEVTPPDVWPSVPGNPEVTPPDVWPSVPGNPEVTPPDVWPSVPGKPEVTPPNVWPNEPTDPNHPENPGNPGNTENPHIRPQVVEQVPSYISAPMALTMYNNLMMDDIHKRLGEIRHANASANESQGMFYSRVIGSKMKYKTDVDFVHYGYDFDLDMQAIQLGANLFHFDDQTNLFSGGIAYTRGETTLKPKAVDGYSETKFNSNTLSLYLTWQHANRFYLDGVLSYTDSKGKVNTTNGEMNRLKARSWSASIEAGYAFDLGNDWILEPQVQLIYSSINLKDSIDKDNAKIHYDRYNQTTARVGVRASKTWVNNNGTQSSVYGRFNYYHHFGSEAKLNIGNAAIIGTQGYDFRGGKQGNAIQAGVGGTVTFDNNLSIYGEVDYQKNLGSYGQKGWRANVGLKWTF